MLEKGVSRSKVGGMVCKSRVKIVGRTLKMVVALYSSLKTGW